MFKRLQRIEKKLDAIIAGQAVHARMLEDILETLDQRQANSAQQKAALTGYIDSVSGILQAQGAPPEFVQSFKDLLGHAS